MRINHNITAMNSYRNFSKNTSNLSKNLEKVSTGLKINRAGDDAAGLAISEKMRVQISGLEAATKNAKDGISLVQTAEGAMTEIHDMLNRMVQLTEQSANGTYDDSVDRNQLQKEVDALKTEIDRIADSTNYNGIKLLDGSLSSDGAAAAAATSVDVSKLGVNIHSSGEEVKSTNGVYQTSDTFAPSAGTTFDTSNGQKFSMKVSYKDAEGNDVETTVTLKVTNSASTGKDHLVLDDGTEKGIELSLTYAAANKVSQTELTGAFKEALNKDEGLRTAFKITTTNSDKGLTFTAREGGTAGAELKDYELSFKALSDTVPTRLDSKVQIKQKAVDAGKAFNMGEAQIWDGQQSTLEDSIFEVNGKKFLFANMAEASLSEEQKTMLAEAGVGNNFVSVAASDTINGATDAAAMAKKIANATGLTVSQYHYDGTSTTLASTGTYLKFDVPSSTVENAKGKGGLTLQIGDTSDSFNKLTVSIEDMHSKSIGIGEVDISTQEGAAKSVDMIKSAVNFVSNTRGTMGALQNRLDHTINNLGVMRENIQSSESLIRDTDVAEEMMTYTKNNILNQSAQAMLAQANQLPQGVLQLLG